MSANRETQVPSDDWTKDCLHFWGRVLTGKQAHWCADFDYMPIDETCITEFELCTCEKAQ